MVHLFPKIFWIRPKFFSINFFAKSNIFSSVVVCQKEHIFKLVQGDTKTSGDFLCVLQPNKKVKKNGQLVLKKGHPVLTNFNSICCCSPPKHRPYIHSMCKLWCILYKTNDIRRPRRNLPLFAHCNPFHSWWNWKKTKMMK